MNTIKKVFEHLEQKDIHVHPYTEENKLCGYELNTYTNCGVNQIIFIDFRDSELSPKNPKHFIELFNERVNDIDIEEEIKNLMQDKSYMQQIGLEVGIQDLKEWKENLQNVFTTKSPTQRQFEQVVDKLRSQLAAMEETLEMMPRKGYTGKDCQRTAMYMILHDFGQHINGIKLEDFTPNEFSGDFKLSYS